ncbi:MAG: phosphodiesterase [Bilophila wadsworthia]
MRLLIASDLHGSPEAAAFLRRRCEELLPDMLVLLGDYLYHGPRNPLPSSYGPPSVVSVFADFDTPIVAVRGNCDAEVDLMLLPFAVEDSAVIAADGLRIVAQHGHHLPSCPHSRRAPGDVVLSGHTHIPRGKPSTASISGTRQHNAAQGRLSCFLWHLRSRCVPCVRA